MKDRDGNEWVLVPIKATDEMTSAAYQVAKLSARAAINHAIAAAPQFIAPEITDEMCERVEKRWRRSPFDKSADIAMQATKDWLTAWRAELGPQLGMVQLRELNRDELIAISEEYGNIRRSRAGALVMASVDQGMLREGRDIYDAVRAVMGKGEL